MKFKSDAQRKAVMSKMSGDRPSLNSQTISQIKQSKKPKFKTLNKTDSGFSRIYSFNNTNEGQIEIRRSRGAELSQGDYVVTSVGSNSLITNNKKTIHKNKESAISEAEKRARYDQ